MKKLKYLLFTFSFMFFMLPNVNAKSVTYNKQFWITGRSHSNIVDRTYHSITFTGTTSSSSSISRYAIDVENTFGDYDYITFSVYNENTLISSADSNQLDMSITENSNLIAPIVMLNRYPCSVTPIGSDSGSGPWYYDGFYEVVCPVYQKDKTSDFNLEMLALASGNSSSSYWGFSKLFNAFDDGSSYDEVVQSNNQIKDSVNDLNDNITNDNVGGVENSFESFEGFIAENSTITQLITMPITLYTSILNGLQSSCQPFVLGNLFGTNFTLPCINIGSYLGSALWSMIDIIISGFAIFAISKKLIKIFNNFSSMKEGDVIDD